MVTQKKTPGHSDELIIASATVNTNTITSIMMLHTMRDVKLPLKCVEFNVNERKGGVKQSKWRTA